MPLPSRIAKYRIERPLKQGGMGALYLGFDPELERQVAIKVLRDDLRGEEPRARFVREARAAAGLRHPNIVTIHDFGLDEGHPYIVMEYIPGHSLAEIVAQRVLLSIPRRLRIVEDLCTAVGYAHRRHIVHRDIKPGNVMVDADGVVKVLDFGLARTPESALTREGIVMGTLNYMSPEQLSGDVVDHRSDIFAVGAVLYELLAFRQAFGGGVSDGVIVKILQREPEPLPPLTGNVDEELAAVVARSIHKSPVCRYPDLSAMHTDLVAVRTRLERADTLPFPRAARSVNPVVRTTHAGGDAPSSAQAVALLDVAREALSTGEFERALAACDAAVAIDPDTAPTARTLKLQAERQRESSAHVVNRQSASRLGARTRRHLVAGTAVLVALAAGLWTLGDWPSPGQKETVVTTAPEVPPTTHEGRPQRSQSISPQSNVPSSPPPSRAADAKQPNSARPEVQLPPAPRVVTQLSRTEPAPRESEFANRQSTAPFPQQTRRAEPEGTRVATDGLPMHAAQPPPHSTASPLAGRALGVGGTARLATVPTGATGIPEARTTTDSDAHLIGQTLQQYAAAMSAKDIDALETVLTMNASARRRQADLFGRYVSASVKVRPIGPPTIAGVSASVRCAVEEAIEIRGRPRSTGTSVLDVKLRKTGAQWRIVGFSDR